jgi:hypothetical protein
MTVSTDGKTLYVVDHVNRGVYPLDLATQTSGIMISPVHWSDCTCTVNAYRVIEINYARNNGRELLVTTGPQVLDAQSGEVLYGATTVSIFAQSAVSELSGDGRTFYSAGTSGAPHTVRRYELRYSALDDAMGVEAAGVSDYQTAYARGFAANQDGTRLYRACWYDDNTIEVYDGTDLSTISSVVSGTNGGVFLADNDRLFCARYYSAFTSPSPDVWEVDLTNGNIVNEYSVAGEVNERQMVVSADGMRLVTRSNSRQTLTFTER